MEESHLLCNFALPNNGKMVKRWTVGLSHFPVVRRVPRVRPGAYPESIQTMKKKFFAAIASAYINKVEHGWHSDTNLGCDVKTILRSDRRMEAGKEYQGIFRLDAEAVTDEFLCRDAHYTFVEAALPPSSQRRNVRLFEGRHITCTVRTDGKLRLNFKGLKSESLRNVDSFALEVANEIQSALRGLVGEK